MSKYVYGIYAVVSALTVFAYATMYRYLIYWPEYTVTVSNLTLDYVIMSFALGTFTGWYAWSKAFVKRGFILRFAGTVILSLVAVSMWLIIAVVVGGYHLRQL